MSIEKENFVQKYKQAVVNACKGTGIFPSIAMAQMILESGIGKSQLSAKYNNFFGIKAFGNWQGRTVRMNTPHDATPTSLFRVYDNAQQSIEDHNTFLKVNPRYTKAGVFRANTWQQQIEAIAKAGYAEDKNYVAKITGEITKYKLYQLDGFTSNSGDVPTSQPPIAQAGFGDFAILILALFFIGKYFFSKKQAQAADYEDIEDYEYYY